MNKENNWKLLAKIRTKNGKLGADKIFNTLLKNRGIGLKKQKEEFFNPTNPEDLTLKSLGIDRKSVNKAIKRIISAKKSKQKIIIYGDYDTDGICASAIIWECLYYLGFDVTPYIPERFSEGYGLNAASIQKLKIKYKKLKLIITVDNGIVANAAVKKAKQLGIDVIVTDHHEPGEKYPKVHSVIHTTKIGGAAIAWIFSREIKKKLKIGNLKLEIDKGLDLACLGTIADQLPLTNANRSFAKHGLVHLNKTNRPGLKQLFLEASLESGSIDSYSIGFVIAPRLNATGRLEHAIDSLRLLCTKNTRQARELAQHLGSVNKRRQNVVDEVLKDAREKASRVKWKGAIVLWSKSYHEGVIGLAASKLVEEFSRPAIVISEGKNISKASARSIPGFNLIDSIRKFSSLLEGHGGHRMAAGFSLKNKNLSVFSKKYQRYTSGLLTRQLMSKKINIDLQLNLSEIDKALVVDLQQFEPFGLGNPRPLFLSKNVKIIDPRIVGGKHVKFYLRDNSLSFSAIGFNLLESNPDILKAERADVIYSLDLNRWNNQETIQLKIKDIKIIK